MTARKAPGPVRTWHHSRKGRITGILLRDDGFTDWVTIQLVGDHDLKYYSDAHQDNGPQADGEKLTLRRSFLTEVTS